ncbi:MAG: hypothetical protein R8N50_01980 [Alphaproteobacteria bacterium]|nr:hypothetical protein [Alphaproteobacteria bacterium]
MQNKKMFLLGLVFCGAISNAFAAMDIIEEIDVNMEEVSANAVAGYDVTGSLFQQITNLEQEKVLMELEKERAQLDLELDRLAAEKIKLHMEIDTLSGRAEQQQQEIETQKAKLEAEAARIEREKENWLADMEAKNTSAARTAQTVTKQKPVVNIADDYRLVNVSGAGGQLQATVEDLKTGQSKRVRVGKVLGGLKVKSISLYDGIVLVDKKGTMQTLNISKGK